VTAGKPVPVRIEPELYARIVRLAEMHRRTVTAEVNALLAEVLQ
jgi:hypothetical protein